MAKVKTRTTAVLIGLVVVAAAVFVKLQFFPSVRESYFALSERNLQKVHSGLLVLRPTRFSRSHFNGIVATTVRVFGKPAPRLIGRNVSFRDLIAAAYGRNAATIALPADAPKTNFDFLVTTRGDPQGRLREAIRKDLGFVARLEPHDTEVLALKVQDANLPGLTVNETAGRGGVHFKDGKLLFTHVRLGALTGGLEQALGMPVVDKTGLTKSPRVANIFIETDGNVVYFKRLSELKDALFPPQKK